MLLADIAYLHTNMGFIGLRAFPAAILGGLESIPGALLGGLLIGLVENLSGAYLDPILGGGPNGAGKTTVFNCISRICRQDSGQIHFEEREISPLKPHAIPGIGIGRTFQNIELFAGLTTLENIVLGRHLRIRSGLFGSLLFTPGARRAENQTRRAAEEIVDFLELETVRHQTVGDLPYGIRKKIEIGRALATAPRLLLLDEPAAGMNAEEREELAFWLRRIKTELHVTLLLVEHDMRFVMQLSDRVCVLDSGRVIAAGIPAEVQENPAVREAYLGRTRRAS